MKRRAIAVLIISLAGVFIVAFGFSESLRAGFLRLVSADPGTDPASSSRTGTGPPAEEKPSRTEAEKILGLRNLIEDDRQWRTSFEEDFSRLTSQLEQATQEFGTVDARLRRARRPSDGTDAPAGPAGASPELEKQWAAARDAVDSIIQRRKAVRRQVRTLEEKLTLMESALNRLTSVDPPAALGETPERSPAPAIAQAPAGQPTASSPAPGPRIASRPEEPTDPEEESLVDARRALTSRLAALRDAVGRVERLDRGIDVVGRDLESTRQMLEGARRDLKDASQSVSHRAESGPAFPRVGPPDLPRIEREREEANRRLEQARREVGNQVSRVAESEALLERLRGDRGAADRRADDLRSGVEASRRLVFFLESPLAPHQLFRWLRGHAPQVLGVALLMLAIWWVARFAGRRVMAGLVRRGRLETAVERRDRAETLLRVFDNTTGIAVLGLGGLAILDQAGLNISVLLGGAAVLGAAIAFGTQNLVKDYFSGFMILVENQYSVGNVISFGDTTGTVEDITLRTTVLRDIEGVVHFVPHSQVTKVSNLTHGWSNVVMGIGVGPGEDVDRVMDLLMNVARGLGREDALRDQILGEPEMLGVDTMSASSTLIKFRLKTRPHMRWQVKRELLRRIKKAFDREGIKVS